MTLALADSPSLGSASCSCFGPSAPSVDRHTPRSAAFPFSLRMKGHVLKQSNAMVISPSCPPPQDAPSSASGTASGTARQSSFSATESGDTPRRWGQGGVQQGEETGPVSRAPSALTTAAGTERTSRPVQIHPWLECYSWDHAVLRLRREKEGYWDALDRSASHQPPAHREGRRFTPAS